MRPHLRPSFLKPFFLFLIVLCCPVLSHPLRPLTSFIRSVFGGQPCQAATTDSQPTPAEKRILEPPEKKKPKKSPEEKVFQLTKFHSRKVGTRKMKATPEQLVAFFQDEFSREYILIASNYKQISSDTFRCEMQPFHFFSAKISPVLDIKVTVNPKAPSAHIWAVSGKIKKGEGAAGSTGVGFAHGGQINEASFSMDTDNAVSWKALDDSTVLVTCDIRMEISMEKPSWIVVGNRMVMQIGNVVLAQVLKATLPDFLNRLEKGYKAYVKSKTI